MPKKTLPLQPQFYLCHINLESWHSTNHHPCLWTKCRNDSEAWNDTEVACPLKQELQIVLLLGGRANCNIHTWYGLYYLLHHNIWKKLCLEEESTYNICWYMQCNKFKSLIWIADTCNRKNLWVLKCSEMQRLINMTYFLVRIEWRPALCNWTLWVGHGELLQLPVIKTINTHTQIRS